MLAIIVSTVSLAKSYSIMRVYDFVQVCLGVSGPWSKRVPVSSLVFRGAGMSLCQMFLVLQVRRVGAGASFMA